MPTPAIHPPETTEQPSAAHLPSHIAVIMDGNGRWAKRHGLPRLAGHRKGAEAARAIVEEAGKLGIGTMTLYAFSSENWDRPADEVNDLMQLLGFYLDKEAHRLHANRVRLRVVGDLTRLDANIRHKIDKVEAMTAANAGLCLNMALSYGGRQEITHAMRTLASQVKNGALAPDAITEQTIAQVLYTRGSPDPDLLIRTGGDKRISNFLLWQIAYAELYFTEALWPDFTPELLHESINDFQQRERRFGRRSAV